MRRAFTLVELLVVVTIISLLAALLVPAMEEAFAHAQRAMCMSNQRQVHVANVAYANEMKDQYVPVKTEGASGSGYESWSMNRHFITLNGLRPATSDWLALSWPGGFLSCPIARPFNPAPNGKTYVWDTLAFNWAGVSDDFNDALVVRRSTIRSPSDKVQMVDCNDWHTAGKGPSWLERADYERYWDSFGDVDKFTQNAMVTYRHQQGAVIQHFDGHAEYYHKEQAWKGSDVADRHRWDVYE